MGFKACGEEDAGVWAAGVVKQAEDGKDRRGDADFVAGLNRRAGLFCKR